MISLGGIGGGTRNVLFISVAFLGRDLKLEESVDFWDLGQLSFMNIDMHRFSVRYGVTANITAFHAVARGSTPRIGNFF